MSRPSSIRSSSRMNMDYRALIITDLKLLRDNELFNKQTFKANAYSKVIKQLEVLSKPIHTIDDLNDINGIGKSIKTKIEQIFVRGFSVQAEKVKADNNVDAFEKLTAIMGIGPVKARELIEQHQVASLEKLKENLHLLNEKQKLGVLYHDDFQQRIERKEMTEHHKFLSKLLKRMQPKITFELTGSYRRKKKDSGDIDVLVTCKDNFNECDFKKIINLLKESKYLIDDFGFGGKKYMGVCKLESAVLHRRIDIMFTTPEEFPFALLYFTGSQEFNIKMRNKALQMGYSLNEYGLTHLKDNVKVQAIFETEKDIFDFLEMEYVEPKFR